MSDAYDKALGIARRNWVEDLVYSPDPHGAYTHPICPRHDLDAVEAAGPPNGMPKEYWVSLIYYLRHALRHEADWRKQALRAVTSAGCGDADDVQDALDAASDIELHYGDYPQTRRLAEALGVKLLWDFEYDYILVECGIRSYRDGTKYVEIEELEAQVQKRFSPGKWKKVKSWSCEDGNLTAVFQRKV